MASGFIWTNHGLYCVIEWMKKDIGGSMKEESTLFEMITATQLGHGCFSALGKLCQDLTC